MMEILEQIGSSFNLRLGLLVGTGLLAICLLVLALTRWGQSSPVWKCVALSVAAHILLVLYAYGTNMVFEPSDPGMAAHEDFKVNLISAQEELSEAPEILQAIPDWKNDLPPEILPQVVEPLDRPEIDSEVVIERVLNTPADLPELDLKTEAPPLVQPDPTLEVRPDFKPEMANLDQTLPKLESPEMPVERKHQTDSTLTEPPQFRPSEDWSNKALGSDLNAASSDETPANPHLKGIDSNLLDPHSQFAQPDSGLQLPPPALNSTDSHHSITPSPPDSRFQRVSSSWRAADGKPLPAIYSLRHAVDRQQVVQQRGGSAETEEAVKNGLQWLVQSQEDDGRWDADRWGAGQERQVFGHDRKGAGADADTGITGLATLALLAGGHSHLEGPYQSSVRHALAYLISKQKPTGDLAGDARMFARTYCHSMALLALSESLAVTGDQNLRSAVQKGVDYSVQTQNRQDGGWRYHPGDPGDMSQHGWQVLALKSAQMGGARVPQETFERMQHFVNSCSSGSFGGLSSYRPRQGVSTSMTAEALVCRFILDQELNHNLTVEAANRISTERPNALNINLYYWYYGTLAMYQVGGSDWELWNTEMKKALLSTQVRSGFQAGSWSPDCLWGGYGGRVYSTALATLNLQVYYRYMPNQRSASTIDDPSANSDKPIQR
jgi:hypothetical protein